MFSICKIIKPPFFRSINKTAFLIDRKKGGFFNLPFLGNFRTENVNFSTLKKWKSTEKRHAEKKQPKTLDSKTFFAQFCAAVQQAPYSAAVQQARYSTKKSTETLISQLVKKKYFFLFFLNRLCIAYEHSNQIPIKFQSICSRINRQNILGNFPRF